MDPLDLIDAELARCRGSLCDLADALTLPARTAITVRRGRRRARLRAIAAIAAIAITLGAASAVAAFAAPARVLTHIGYHPGRAFDFDHDGDKA